MPEIALISDPLDVRGLMPVPISTTRPTCPVEP